MAENFLQYMKCSLLTTFGNSETKQIDILEYYSMASIIDFCQNLALYDNIYLYFIIDQLNALDYDKTNKDKLSNNDKREIQNAINKITSLHFIITCASVNCEAALYLELKQTTEIKILLFGGLTKVCNFFIKLCFVIFSYTKQLIVN